MDVSQLNTSVACQQARTIDVEVDGKPTDVKIEVIGADAPKAKRAMAAVRAKLPMIGTRRTQLQERLKNIAEGTDEHAQILDALANLDSEETAVWCRYMAECTVTWHNIEDKGTPIPFDVETAESLYVQSQPLQAAVLPSVMDRAAFLGNASKPGRTS